MKRIVFVAATNNKGKLAEINDILKSAGHGCISLAEAGVECDAEENGTTFLENSFIKSRAAFAVCKRATLADDSGVMVDALDGAPGVHTARYAGDECDHDKNIDKLLLNLKEVPKAKRTARFVSVVTAVTDDGREFSATGVTEGYIGYERRGDKGFGYDPIFYVRGNRSFAELSDKRKNEISHRARAIRKLCFMLRGIKRIKL